MSAAKTRELISGLVFPEGPRWHDGALYLSDIHGQEVVRVSLAGKRETVARVPGRPSGLGWLPDGSLLIVAMFERKLLRLEAGSLAVVADLAPLAAYHWNDMVVDRAGRAYIGNFGCDLFTGDTPKPTPLALVHPDGRVQVAATDLVFPNGIAISADGRTMVVAESFAARLTAFDVAADGSLSKRRVFAQLESNVVPDGIAIDAEGAIWMASPPTGECLRVHDGGRISARVRPAKLPYACALGGPGRKTLFMCTSETHDPDEAIAKRSGAIECIEVEVPGAGWP